jgi:hypothetical protein
MNKLAGVLLAVILTGCSVTQPTHTCLKKIDPRTQGMGHFAPDPITGAPASNQADWEVVACPSAEG